METVTKKKFKSLLFTSGSKLTITNTPLGKIYVVEVNGKSYCY